MQLYSPFMPRSGNRFVRAFALLLPVAILSFSLVQTVFARNTFVINDGENVTVHSTYATDPAEVLEEAGVTLSGEDYYTTDGSSEIIVQRSRQITVEYCGERIELTAYDETLAEVLDRNGMKHEGAYRASVPVSTKVYDGMSVRVDWVVSNMETYTVELPFETVYVDDPTLPAGAEAVLVEGQVGYALRRSAVTFENAVETDRKVMDETVKQEPVDRLIAVGTGENVGGTNQWPLIGDGYIVLSTGEVLTYTHSQEFKATAYTSWIEDVGDTTATGTLARVGAIAVDPKLIPYGTRMFIVTNDGSYVYGIATAEDCGGGVNGSHVDLFFDTVAECWQFGVRQCTIYFLGDADKRGPQNR